MTDATPFRPTVIEVVKQGPAGPAIGDWRGAWAAGTYRRRSLVEKDGSTWLALRSTAGVPGISADWDLVVSPPDATEAAVDARDEALIAKAGAETARGGAEAARAGAEDAQGGAEDARDAALEARDDAFQAIVNPGVYYDTLSELEADLAHPDGTMGVVDDDGVASGIYRKVGAPGSGSWVKKSDDTIQGSADRVAAIRSDLSSTSDPENGAGASGYDPTQPYASTTVGAELNRKRAEAVNVLDYGASPSATTTVNNAAFLAAYTAVPAGGFVIIPPGNYPMTVFPPSTGKVMTWIAYGVAINSSVNSLLTAPGVVQAGGTIWGAENVYAMYATENNKGGPVRIRRSTNKTGGTNGFVTPALSVYTTTSGNGENFEWGLVSELYNSATGNGQNSAGYFRAIRMVENASPMWGMCIEAGDNTGGAPGGQLVALEIDIDGDGDPGSTSKTTVKRVGLDLTARVKTRSGTGIFGRADYGVRIRTNSQGGANDAGYKYAHLYLAGKTDGVVIDATDVEGTDIPVLCLKNGDRVRLSNSGERELFYSAANSALTYAVNGVDLLRVTDTGIVRAYGVIDADTEVRVSNVKVVGDRSLGWTAMTGTSSKGALAATSAGTASASYVQAELQTALNRIAALEARMRAYDSALFAHGLIGL